MSDRGVFQWVYPTLKNKNDKKLSVAKVLKEKKTNEIRIIISLKKYKHYKAKFTFYLYYVIEHLNI